MRKKIIDPEHKHKTSAEGQWLELSRLAQVELTSEDAAYPIESALEIQGGSGWRASQSGRQCIRIIFDEPQRVSRIQLLFEEDQQERTQEFVLRWSSDGGHTYQEIIRQQYNFSPGHASRELEDYTVELAGVTTMELNITPDINQGNAIASLQHLYIA